MNIGHFEKLAELRDDNSTLEVELPNMYLILYADSLMITHASHHNKDRPLIIMYLRRKWMGAWLDHEAKRRPFVWAKLRAGIKKLGSRILATTCWSRCSSQRDQAYPRSLLMWWTPYSTILMAPWHTSIRTPNEDLSKLNPKTTLISSWKERQTWTAQASLAYP